MRNLIALIMFTLSTFCSIASAATVADIQKLREIVSNGIMPRLDSHKSLLLSNEKKFSGETHYGDSMVIFCSNARYTIEISKETNPEDFKSGWVMFVVEKEEQPNNKSVDIFFDRGFDGTVDGGSNNTATNQFETGLVIATGEEYREYWQQYLDETVESILSCQ